MSRFVLWNKLVRVFSPALVLTVLIASQSYGAWPGGDAALQLETAPIADLRAAAEGCEESERPVIGFTSNRDGLTSWPGQYIQLSWNIKGEGGLDWTHPVYLRLGETVDPGKPVGETVTPLWTRSLKASLMREGLQKYYLVTRCGVAGVNVGLVPRPVITNSPATIFKGDVITIRGRNFMEYAPEYLLRVIVAEAGMDHTIKVLEWSEGEIRALATFDTEYGRHDLVVDIGLNSAMHRRSDGKAITVVKRDIFPPVMITSAVNGVFSGMKIHLNTFGPSPDGSWFEAEDSYIEPSTGMALVGEKRVTLDIPEYNFTPHVSEGAGDDAIKGPLYYINDINMYIAQVLTSGDKFTMTFFFEDLHDEFVGRAANPDAALPPPIQLDNLRVEFSFILAQMDGLVAPEFISIETKGDFRGTGSYCDYGEIDICKLLYVQYEEDILRGLTEKITAMLGSETGKKAFARALATWLRTQGIGEVTGVGFTDGSVFIDHIPR